MARLFSLNDACDILLHELISRQAHVYEAPNESLLVSITSINFLNDFPPYPYESKARILYVYLNSKIKLLHGVQ